MPVRTSSAPITDYKESNDAAASLGFASSIINGNTTEGGLRSITYKAVYAASLIDELDMARKAVVPGEEHLTTIVTKDYANESTLQRLQHEIESIRKSANAKFSQQSGDARGADSILRLNQQLGDDLVKTKQYSEQLSADVSALSDEVPDLNQKLSMKRMALATDVRTMENVENFDGSIYQRAEERRRQEEVEKLENEGLLAAQKQAFADQQAQEQTQEHTSEHTQEQAQERIQNHAQFQALAEVQDHEMLAQEAGINDDRMDLDLPQIPLSEIAQPIISNPEISAEQQLPITEPSLGDLSYAIESDVSMAPNYGETYIAASQSSDHISSMPQFDASYLQNPGPP